MASSSFPRLTGANSRPTSPADRAYNCLAWAAGVTNIWWQPGPDTFWPVPETDESEMLPGLIAAYRAVGFVPCDSAESIPDHVVIALYATADGGWSHAARQLPSGKWTSKLGKLEDIEHDTPDDVAGGAYGEVVAYMRRPIA